MRSHKRFKGRVRPTRAAIFQISIQQHNLPCHTTDWVKLSAGENLPALTNTHPERLLRETLHHHSRPLQGSPLGYIAALRNSDLDLNIFILDKYPAPIQGWSLTLCCKNCITKHTKRLKPQTSQRSFESLCRASHQPMQVHFMTPASTEQPVTPVTLQSVPGCAGLICLDHSLDPNSRASPTDHQHSS